MIAQGIALSFFAEILQGVHQPGDAYMLALYTPDADLSEATEKYSTVGEVVGGGYKAGGKALVGYNVTPGPPAVLSWAEQSWPRVSVRARGGLVYNLSKGNRAVAVLDFGGLITSTNGAFIVTLPEQLISIGA